MAYLKGTASNFDDLFAKLVNFLTTDPTLVSQGQAHTLVFRSQPTSFSGKLSTDISRQHAIFRGPGLAGGDQIYTGVSTYGNTADDYYNFRITGGSGFNSSALVDSYGSTDSGMLGKSPAVAACFWNQPMTFWFFANGRRWFCVVKVNTIYTTFGAGLILQSVLPSQYPYPLAIWGTNECGNFNPVRWSDTSITHSGPTTAAYRNMYLRQPGGRWADFYGSGTVLSGNSASAEVAGGAYRCILPVGGTLSANPNDYPITALRDCPGGSFPLFPITLISYGTEGTATYGEADGLFFVPTLNNGSEDEIIVGGVSYLVFQTVFRTGSPYLFALRVD